MDEDARGGWLSWGCIGCGRGTVEMWHVHNVIPEQQEHVVERVGAEVACIVPTP